MIYQPYQTFDNKEDLKKLTNEIKEAFEIIDVDGKNQLNLVDLKLALMSFGLKVSNDELKRINKNIKNKYGEKSYLTYDEFQEICIKLIVFK
jgi:Ca2+-binding EF-hand superfamily protein